MSSDIISQISSTGRISSHIGLLRPSATLAMNELSSYLQKSGKEIFRLGFGQSPFPIPDRVVQSLSDNAYQKDYLPVKGLPALRLAIADYYNFRFGLGWTQEDVLIAPGSKELLFLTQMVLNGTLLLPSPSWVSYAPQAAISKREVKWVDAREDRKWLITGQDLARTLSDKATKSPTLLLNYPSNPAGSSMSVDRLREIAEIARSQNLVILSDEIYSELHFDGKHRSIAEFYPEGTIISSGMSKWCGAGGWRLGTFIFPPGLRSVLNAMATVASETYSSTSAPIQYAATTAFQGGPDIDNYLKAVRKVLKSIGVQVHLRLSEMGITCPKPEGGFYLFPNFGLYKEAMVAKKIRGSRQLCKALLQETGVALLPGEDFGRPSEELTARLSFVDFDGKRALQLANSSGHVGDTVDLDDFAPKIKKAMNRLESWLSELGRSD